MLTVYPCFYIRCINDLAFIDSESGTGIDRCFGGSIVSLEAIGQIRSMDQTVLDSKIVIKTYNVYGVH